MIEYDGFAPGMRSFHDTSPVPVPPAPPAPPEPPPPPPPPPVAKIGDLILEGASLAQVNAALKARMATLLTGQVELDSHSATTSSDRALRDQAQRRLADVPNVPESADEATLGAYLTMFCELHLDAAASQNQFYLAYNTEGSLAKAQMDGADILAGSCALVGKERPDLVEELTPLLAAARHLIQQVRQASKSRSENERQTIAAADAGQPTVVEQANAFKLDALTHAVKLGRARILAPQIAALERDLNRTATGYSVVQPVRPTEEEVQRYMMQTEQRMRERLKVRRASIALFDEKDALLADFDQSWIRLNAIVRRPTTHLHPVVAAAQAALARVLEDHSRVVNDLQYASDIEAETRKGYDVHAGDPATPAETQTIEDLRKAMRELAYSFGRLNEAKTAEEETRNKGEAKVSFEGAVRLATAKQSLLWIAEKEAAQEEARKKNLSREVKLELLKESVQAYTTEVRKGRTRLHRYVVGILPRPGVKPCDDLRCLFNAAAWLYNDMASDIDEAVFPLY